MAHGHYACAAEGRAGHPPKERDGFPMIQGFKKFIMRGNVIDLAVAVVIANAFKPIVDNLVKKVINPFVGGLFGKPNFDSVGEFTVGKGENAATVQPGSILTALVSFLLVAAAVYFCLVYPMNKANERLAKRKGLNAEEAEISDEVRLLTEIRDALGGGYVNGSGYGNGSGHTGGGYRQ